jgi:outer membrane protein assembly factor BamB
MISVTEKRKTTRTHTSECADIELAFFDFKAGRLSDLEKHRISVHLQGCTSCRDLYGGAGEAFLKIRAQCLNQSLPTDFKKKLQQTLTQEIDRKRKLTRFRNIKRTLAIPVFGVVIVSALFTVVFIKKPLLIHQSAPETLSAAQIPAVWKLSNITAFKESVAQSPVVFGENVFGVQDDQTGRRLLAVDIRTGKTLWRSETGLLGFISADSSRVYALRRDHAETRLCAWEARGGRVQWTAAYPEKTTGQLRAPTVAGNDLLYTKNDSLYCLSGASGAMQWGRLMREAGAVSAPCPGNKAVYVAGSEHVYALTLDNKPVWKFTYPEPMVSSPAPLVAISQGYLFAAHRSILGNSTLFCIDLLTGKLVWRKDNEECRSMVASGEHLFVRARDIRAFDQASGRCQWTHSIDGCGPLTCDGNILYVSESAEKGILVKLDARSGRILQRTASGGSCSGIMVAGDLELVHGIDGVLYAYKNTPVSSENQRPSLQTEEYF